MPSLSCLNYMLYKLHVQVTKNLKDLHGPALTLVLERLKPHGTFQGASFILNLVGFDFIFYFSVLLPANPTCVLPESFESAKATSMGLTSKSSSKVGKSAANGVPKHGNRALSSVRVPP